MFFVISSCKKLFVMNVGEVNFSCCRAFVYIVWKKVPTRNRGPNIRVDKKKTEN